MRLTRLGQPRMGRSLDHHSYRIRLDDDGCGAARDIEFEARGSDIALLKAEQLCGSRHVTMFEDGRKLADLQLVNGFWFVG